MIMDIRLRKELWKQANDRKTRRLHGTLPPLKSCVVCGEKIPYTGNRPYSKLGNDDVVMWLGKPRLREDFHYKCLKTQTVEGCILAREEQYPIEKAEALVAQIYSDIMSICEGSWYGVIDSLRRIRNTNHRLKYLCKLLHYVEPCVSPCNANDVGFTLYSWNQKEEGIHDACHLIYTDNDDVHWLLVGGGVRASRYNIARCINGLFHLDNPS